MVSNPACYAYLLKALQWMLLCVQYAWIYYGVEHDHVEIVAVEL